MRTSSSTWTLVRLSPPHVLALPDQQPHRPHHPLQLEHQTSLPLPKSRLPIHARLRTRLRSHHLGRHPRLVHRALEPAALCASRLKIQIQIQDQSPTQDVQEGPSRSESEIKVDP
jgi:hypothetical protein